MRIDLHHRLPASLLVGRVVVAAHAGERASIVRGPGCESRRAREGKRWCRPSGYRPSGCRASGACRPAASIELQLARTSQPSPMSTFVGLTQNGLDPEVSPA